MKLLLGIAFCTCTVAAKAQELPDAPPRSPTPAPNVEAALAAAVPLAGLTGAFDWKLRLQPGQKWEIRTFIRMTQLQDRTAEPAANTPVTPEPANLGAITPEPVTPVPATPGAVAPDFPPPAALTVVPVNPAPANVPVRSEVQLLQRSTMDYEVLAVDKFGASTVRLGFRELMFDMKRPATPNAKAENVNTVLTGLERVAITVKQAPDGTIWNVYGVEGIQQRLLKSATTLSAEQKAQAQFFMAQFESDKYWRTFFRSLTGSLPKFPVIVSESWDYDTAPPVNLPNQLAYHGKRTLKTRKDGVAFVQEEATLDAGDFEIKLGQPVANPTKYGGTFSGTSQIDEKTGLPNASNFSFKMTGLITDETATPGAEIRSGGTFTATGETRTVMTRK